MRDRELDWPAALLGEPAGEQLGLLDRPRQDDRPRDVGCARVVLQHEAAQQLGLAYVSRAIERVTVVPHHLPLADVGDLDEHVVAAARIGDDVLVVAAPRQHLLTVGDALDGMQLVAVARGVLEIQPRRRRLHAVVKLADQEVGAALHEKAHLVDARLVVLGADPSLAWPGTPFDVEVEAHLALPEDLVAARAEGKQLADRFDRRAQRLRGRVRAEILRPVVQHAPRVVDARKVFRHRQLQVEVVLVVLEPDVEARPVVLDEVVLEDERLDLVGRGDELEIGGPADELGHTRRLRVTGGEIRAEPVAEAQRLADIDDLRLAVSKQVDARTVGNGLEPSLDRVFEGSRHFPIGF